MNYLIAALIGIALIIAVNLIIYYRQRQHNIAFMLKLLELLDGYERKEKEEDTEL